MHMQVKDFMTKIIVTADNGTTLVDAAKLMAAENVGSLLVTKNEELVGMVTREDVIAAQLLSEEVYQGLTLADIMQTPVVSISPTADLGQLIGFMDKTGKRYIPVIESDAIIGLVSASDVIRVLAKVKLVASGLDEED